MLTILSDYLKEAATPELREALEGAHDAFDRINLENYTLEFEKHLMQDGSVDRGNTLVFVTELTRLMLTDLLRQHEIIPAHDASIETLTLFLNGILDIQEYENYADIINIVAMESNAQETFAELMTLVSPRSVEDLLVDLEEVHFAVITRIRDMAIQMDIPPPSVQEQEQERAYIEKLNRFLGYIQQKPLQIVAMLKNGLDVGFPFLTYVGLIGAEIEQWPVDKIANELMAMALVSNDGTNNPLSIIKEHLENYISDMNKLTKVDIKLGEISLGLQR